jgi:UDP-N-acetylglucosamine 2-epimerase (non-hydrolysing)
VRSTLGGISNVVLTPPLEYPEFVRLLDLSSLVLTDSGGVQEEVPSLGKPVLVLRDDTERPEGIEARCAELVGTDTDRIVAAAGAHLNAPLLRESIPAIVNPYGDGQAARRVLEAIRERLAPADPKP